MDFYHILNTEHQNLTVSSALASAYVIQYNCTGNEQLIMNHTVEARKTWR